MQPKMKNFEANRKIVLAVIRDVTAENLENTRSERLLIKIGFIVGVTSLICGIMGAASSCNRKYEIKKQAPMTETIRTIPEEQVGRTGIICEI